MTREERMELLDDCICPLCGERQADFEELLACLQDHLDEGFDIAIDFIDVARDLMLYEDAESILEDSLEEEE